jgi:hypothetical protein
MKWNEKSLEAFALWRYILSKQDLERIDLTSLSSDYPGTLGNPELLQANSFEENLLNVKDNIWLVFKLNNVEFFVITHKDNKKYCVQAIDLVDFTNERMDLGPVWWPSHFETPEVCDAWVAEQILKLESSISENE